MASCADRIIKPARPEARRCDWRADLRETVRALAAGEVAGLELWAVDFDAMSLTVLREDDEAVEVALVGGLWRVEGGVSGGDLMALVKGVADAAR